MLNRITRLSAYPGLVEVAVNVFSPLDLFVFPVDVDVAQVIPSPGKESERRIRVYFFGLNSVRSVNPLDAIIGDRSGAQTIAEIEYADSYKECDHGKGGNQLSLACQVFHPQSASPLLSNDNSNCNCHSDLIRLPKQHETNRLMRRAKWSHKYRSKLS